MMVYEGKYASLNKAVKKGYAVKVFLIEMKDKNGDMWFTEFSSLNDAKYFKQLYKNDGFTNIHIDAITRY